MEWWLIVLLLLIGVGIGVVLTALCAANSMSSGKKWWEDDE